MKKVALYTDGSCLGNPGPGGWAALLAYGTNRRLIYGFESISTNNRMELTAVIEGLAKLKEPCEVHIFTDSKYVMDAFEQNWLDAWQSRNWRTAANREVKNQELWQALMDQVAKHKVRWNWVKGHSGHPENELVNDQAILAARQQISGERAYKEDD